MSRFYSRHVQTTRKIPGDSATRYVKYPTSTSTRGDYYTRDGNEDPDGPEPTLSTAAAPEAPKPTPPHPREGGRGFRGPSEKYTDPSRGDRSGVLPRLEGRWSVMQMTIFVDSPYACRRASTECSASSRRTARPGFDGAGKALSRN